MDGITKMKIEWTDAGSIVVEIATNHFIGYIIIQTLGGLKKTLRKQDIF